MSERNGEGELISEKIEKYIQDEIKKGTSAHDLIGRTIIIGNSVVTLKRSGTKFNLDIKLDCIVLEVD